MTQPHRDQTTSPRLALRQRRRLPAALGALSISASALFGVCVLTAPAHAEDGDETGPISGISDPTPDPVPSETPLPESTPDPKGDDDDDNEQEAENDDIGEGSENEGETTGGSESEEGDEAPVVADVVVAAPVAANTVANANSVIGAAGAAAAGQTITVTDPASGQVLGTAAVASDGSFTVELASSATDGAQLQVTATDAEGNASDPVTVTVDAVAPAEPVVTAGDENGVFGTGEPGSTVIVTASNGDVLGTAVVDEDGQWSIEFASPLEVGDVIAVTAYDAAGNISETGAYELYEETVTPDPADDGTESPAADVTKTGFTATDDPTAQENGKTTTEGLALKTGGHLADVSQRNATDSGWAATLLALLGATGAVGSIAVVRKRRQHSA